MREADLVRVERQETSLCSEEVEGKKEKQDGGDEQAPLPLNMRPRKYPRRLTVGSKSYVVS